MISSKHHSTSWLQDYDERMNPELLTSIFQSAVPVLKQTNWHVSKVEPGYCESVLPLNRETTNQHGTHQAALISLAADYTGGLAMATLLRGVPIAGAHNCNDSESVSLWLASMNVKYLSPSTGHLVVSCRVPSEEAERITSRYFAGKRVLTSLPISFVSNDDNVAEGEMKYFAQPSSQLMPTAERPQATKLFQHKIKASARMIAGLRSERSSNTRMRVECPHAATAAGPHGRLLANRLQSVLPQLKAMVIARTRHVNETILAVPNLQQVVLLGAGLDMRPFSVAKHRQGVTFFECDLPEMLEERKRVITKMDIDKQVTRYPVTLDFRIDSILDKIGNHSKFDPSAPTVFVYEGCSMYFDAALNRSIFHAISQLLQNAQSRVWCDFVTNDVVEGKTQLPELEAFLAGMEELGERFIYGVDNPTSLMRQCGFTSAKCLSSGQYIENSDPAYSIYRFVVARVAT